MKDDERAEPRSGGGRVPGASPAVRWKDEEPLSDRGPVRNTAPAGTPVKKKPSGEPSAPPALVSSDRPPPGSQNTLTLPRTVGGHTARLKVAELPFEEPMLEEIVPPAAPAIDRTPATVRGGGSEEGGVLAPQVEPPLRAEPRPQAQVEPRAEPLPRPPAHAEPRPQAHAEPRPQAHPEPPPPVHAEPPPPAHAEPPLPQAQPSPKAASVEAPPPAEDVALSGVVDDAGPTQPRWALAIAVGALSLGIGSLLPLPFKGHIAPSHDGDPAASAAPSLASAMVLAPEIPSASPSAHLAAPATAPVIPGMVRTTKPPGKVAPPVKSGRPVDIF